MSHFPGGLTLEFFRPEEFHLPSKIHPPLLENLDEVRRRCGFPIDITSDIRPPDETAGPHKIHDDGWGHGIDCQPYGDLDWATFHTRKMMIACVAFSMRDRWPNQGIEVSSSHIHLDTSPELKRPYYFGAQSR